MKKKKPIIIRIFFIILFIILLPLFLLALFFKGIYKLHKYNKWRKNKYTINDFLGNAELEKIDVMEGYEFESFLKTMFLYLGYNANTTARTGDYGADLVLTKGNIKTVVQVKRYNKNVSAKCVQEVLVAKTHYSADESMVVTNSYFTKQAEEIARENNTILVNRDNLLTMIVDAKERIADSYKAVKPEMSNDVSVALDENFDNKNRFRI